MKKNILYILLVMLISLSFNSYQHINKKVFFQQNNQQGFQQEDSLIFWSTRRKVTWIDFKGKPNYNEIFAATTYSGIRLVPNSYKDSIILIIKAYFEINTSWVKIKDSSILLLEHEQGHFDITEIGARKIRKIISNATLKDSKSALKFIKDTYYEQWSLKLELDDDYDRETNTGSNKAKQKEWSEKIAKMLKELDDYSSTKVVVKLNP